jgi:uncharacterized RDD family membrane protein YckC
MKYAGAFKRLFAFLIDTIVLMFLYLGLDILFEIPIFHPLFFSLPLYGLCWIAAFLLTDCLYFALLESSSWQATIGKKILRLQVITLSGERIGFWQAILRYFAKMISVLSAYVGLLMIFWTKKKQALHDKIARTCVIEN